LQPKYKRIIFKLSGEQLAGENSIGIDLPIIDRIAQEIKDAHDMGVQIAIVVGGGNIMRGTRGLGKSIERVVADHIGMLGTVINALALQDVLEKKNAPTRVMSAISIEAVCEIYIRRRAIRHLEKNRVVILAAGTGLPFFSTDTAAVLRAGEIQAEAILKGTLVDGVYSSDPKLDANATLYQKISFNEVLTKGLKVIDSTAAALAEERKIPIIVFNIGKPENLLKILHGELIGTLVE
jgi:uridylate kinase